MKTFEEAYKVATEAENEHKVAAQHLRSFGERTPAGLTPDHVKALPEWRTARDEERAAFARLQAANEYLVRTFPQELRAARKAARKP